MPVKRKKVKRFVIDVNTLLTIFINRKTDWLQGYVIQNALEIFIDNNLVEELARVLDYPKIKQRLPLNKTFYLTLAHNIPTFVLADGFSVQCSDPEDDYLYNLIVYVNAKLLVTDEKALLEWHESPVETISLPKFKELF